MFHNTKEYYELELIPVPTTPESPPSPPVHEDKVVQTLRQIRADLERNWIKGRMENAHGQHCLVGSVQAHTYGAVVEYLDDDPSSTLGIALALAHIPIWAMQYCGRLVFNSMYRKTIRALKRQAGVYTVLGLVRLNDEKGKLAVMRLIDKTIESRLAR